MKTLPFAALLLTCFCFVLPTLAQANQAAERQKVQHNIKQVSKSLASQQDKYDKLDNEVTRLEKQLGKISRKQYQTEQKIEKAQVKLREANLKHQKLQNALNVQRAALAQQLQAMYTAGEQSHLRLLLRQDDPSDISRTFRYFEYLNKTRTQRIQGIHKTIAKIKTSREKIDTDTEALAALNDQLDKQKSDIQRTLQSREIALSEAKKNLRSKQRRLNKLKKQEAKLTATLERIAQKRRQAAERAKRKQEQAKRAQKQAAKPAPAVAKKPTGKKVYTRAYTPKLPFHRLKGKLSWPTNGRILHKYKARRNELQRWDGVVISAKGGAAVRAVAAGRVIFSGWMNGYGHLIIVEHDRNYLSLYGYNRATYKKEGELVKANEVIAAVGNSGGQKRNALYFEIRKGRTPQNPSVWCR